MSKQKVQVNRGTEALSDTRAVEKCRRAAQKDGRSSSKQRRSRAVAKAPVRELSAHDKAQFKRIVQCFTGLPTLASPTPSPPPAPPPSPPPLITPIPIRPILSPTPDYPLLATSAIAHNLCSTLHVCLQLLHGSSSPHSNLAIQIEELNMCKSKSLAFFHGFSASQTPREDATHLGSCGGANSLSGVNDFLASLGSHGGGVENISLLGDDDLNPSVDLKLSFGDDGGDPNPLFAMQTHDIPNNTDLKLSFGDDGGDPNPLFAMQTHDIPNNTDAMHPSNSYSSDDCGGSDLKPLLANETHEITTDHHSIFYCDVGLGNYSLSSFYANPLHDTFNDNFNIYHEITSRH